MSYVEGQRVEMAWGHTSKVILQGLLDMLLKTAHKSSMRVSLHVPNFITQETLILQGSSSPTIPPNSQTSITDTYSGMGYQ